jgi:DNA repair exonuclease SbcCD ATPase subunit
VEAITQCDVDSKRALADAQELYASTKVWASTIIKQEEDLAVCTRQVNQWAQDVEELEGQLQEREGQLLEREELDDITLHSELEVLGTRETNLERHEVDLDQEQEALEDTHA